MHSKLRELNAAAIKNHEFMRFIVDQKHVFRNDRAIVCQLEVCLLPSFIVCQDYDDLEMRVHVTDNNISKVRTTLRQCVRDWSSEGAQERQECYTPIIQVTRGSAHDPPTVAHVAGMQELASLYRTPEERKGVKVLVPGCGLARLTWELAHMGMSPRCRVLLFHDALRVQQYVTCD